MVLKYKARLERVKGERDALKVANEALASEMKKQTELLSQILSTVSELPSGKTSYLSVYPREVLMAS